MTRRPNRLLCGVTRLALTLGLVVGGAMPALAEPAAAPDPDEKLPAQLPSVTIQGEDLSGAGAQGPGKLTPTAPSGAAHVRLPEPAQKRATSEGNRALMVSVTPSTIEGAPALPAAVMPYTTVLGGYGPLTQFRVGLYDARNWGPAVGITEVDGRSGWGWSGWRAKEWLDWSGVGRLNLEGQGFAWNQAARQGGQSFMQAGFEHGEDANFLLRADVNRGLLGRTQTSASPIGVGDLAAGLGRVHGLYRLDPMGDHRPSVQLTGQYRTWGRLSGPEAYVQAADFWSLSDAVQLEAGLGGGQWGFEPIIDPKVAFHYRPQGATHLFAGLRTQSELPNFAALYLRRPASAANDALQAERVDGLAEFGGSHRLSEALWASVTGGLRRSQRHIYWADPAGTGLWTPLNATIEQWSPTADGRAQLQWAPNLSQDLSYRWVSVQPLGFAEHRVGTSLDARFLDQKLNLGVGLEGRSVSLSGQQLPGGGTGFGLFAEAEVAYAIAKDVVLSLSASDVPLSLNQPGNPNASYFVPISLLTANVQYQF